MENLNMSAIFGAPASLEIWAAELARQEAETRTIYEAATSDGENKASVHERRGQVYIHTNGGMVYPAASVEDAKRTVDTLIEAWERGDWRIEERLFPGAEYREDYL